MPTALPSRVVAAETWAFSGNDFNVSRRRASPAGSCPPANSEADTQTERANRPVRARGPGLPHPQP
ncbi:hypothetical protein ADL04_33650 [Streptomyces sp. NRRL B-3648]|nr:hypothetical protein ADL04_33650 [Streptomyces sp. NRRL B-3648]